MLDPLGCVLNYAFCNSIPNFSVEAYFVKIFYPIESVPKVNQKQQPSNTKLRQEVDITVTQTSHEVVSKRRHKHLHSNLSLITSVTRQDLDSLTTRQIVKQQ